MGQLDYTLSVGLPRLLTETGTRVAVMRLLITRGFSFSFTLLNSTAPLYIKKRFQVLCVMSTFLQYPLLAWGGVAYAFNIQHTLKPR